MVIPFPGGPEPEDVNQPRALPAPLTVGEGRLEVKLVTIAQGRDLLVQVTGGEAHVGAVAVGYGADCVIPSSGIELMTLPGHKEGPLALAAARRLAEAAGCTVAVVAGIHQDGITAEEIAGILRNVEKAVETLALSLHEWRGT